MTEISYGQDMFWQLRNVPHGLMSSGWFKTNEESYAKYTERLNAVAADLKKTVRSCW